MPRSRSRSTATRRARCSRRACARHAPTAGKTPSARGEYERARFYLKRVNGVPEYSNAQTLWLAARVERRIGNVPGLQDFGRQLRDRFPQAPETALYEQGRFDE